MSNEIMQENTPFVECSAFHRGMSVLEANLRNTEDSEAIDFLKLLSKNRCMTARKLDAQSSLVF